MHQETSHAYSPLQIMASSSKGQLKAGEFGVVMARAGVGKTAFLAQIGLDHLLQGRRVIHVALGGQEVNRLKSWYDTLLADLGNLGVVENHSELQIDIERRRLIQAYNGDTLDAQQLERTLDVYVQHLEFTPDVILLDDQDWSGSVVKTAALLGTLKRAAERLGASLWASARIHRDDAISHKLGIAPPVDAYDEIIDVAIALEDHTDHAAARLLKDRDGQPSSDETILQSDTMRLMAGGAERSTVTLPAGVCTLLSGAATGTEQAFGECAERWGLKELNYSFEGRPVARKRGVVLLNDEQLKRGDVNERYLQEHMRRTYPNTPLFRKVLQSIWHEVNTAGQVFVVGLILDDNTVKGGTGWAAELAKHLKKELYVFDQEKHGWFAWDGEHWQSLGDSPRITSRRFTGTGSRYLSDQGREAIEGLFIDSFGPAE